MPYPVRHLLPFNNENRWSDLLAVFIERDPHTTAHVFGWTETETALTVTREARGEGKDRIDIVVHSGDVLVGVIEVKVLRGLGPDQLERYRRALPDAIRYAVIAPFQLPITVSGGWMPTTWENVLDAFSSSPVSWVAETAATWKEHVDASLPRVSATTIWNEFVADEHFGMAIRARCSWVYGELSPPKGVNLEILQSSAGVSPVVKMSMPAASDGYLIAIEFEERLDSREYYGAAPVPATKVKGPSVKVCLVRTGVWTSDGFDWDYLLALWPTMNAARSDWVQRKPHLKAEHERIGYQRIVDAGAPAYLGIGFGEAQAKMTGNCMFGVRLQLAPDITLAGLVKVMRDFVPLLQDLAVVTSPVTTQLPQSVEEA